MDAFNKVGFCVIGAQKCGTTNLAEHLATHPDVGFCSDKEPDFFSKSDDIGSGLPEYHKLYDFSLGKLLYGEASTSYSFIDEYPETAERMFQYNPDMKIIYIVRDPVARIESHYNHRLRKGYILGDDPVKRISMEDDFVQRGQYLRQLEPFLKRFPSSQIKVLVFEEFLNDQLSAMKDVLKFLELDPDRLPALELSPKNISDAKVRLKQSRIALHTINWLEKQSWSWRLAKWIPIKQELPLAYKCLLFDLLKDDIAALEGYLGRPLNVWRKYQTRTLEIQQIFNTCDGMGK